MRRNAAIIVMGLATTCAVSVLAQGRGNQAAPYVAPAFGTYTPNIPGVVAGGTRVELITDTINGTEGPVAMPDGRGRMINNLAFAGQDKKLLYLVGRGAAWKIRMIAQGYKGRAK
jgi:hypothetical protein